MAVGRAVACEGGLARSAWKKKQDVSSPVGTVDQVACKMGHSLCSVSGERKKQKRIMYYSLGDSSPITAITGTSEQLNRPSGTGPLFLPFPGTSCQATFIWSLRDRIRSFVVGFSLTWRLCGFNSGLNPPVPSGQETVLNPP
jgi:hypothetical protein